MALQYTPRKAAATAAIILQLFENAVREAERAAKINKLQSMTMALLYLRRFLSSSPVTAAATPLPSVSAVLNYQENVPGRRVGRYINGDADPRADHDTIYDVHDPCRVDVHDARHLSPAATMNTKGFELQTRPTAVANFRDDDEVRQVYYPEVEAAVLEAATRDGEKARKVLVFDHTVRISGTAQMNTLGAAGAAAGSVSRVHCDYTADSAPLRLKQLAETESYTGAKLDDAELASLLSKSKHGCPSPCKKI